MIYARKSRVLERLFVAGLRRVFRRRFYGVFVRGLANLETPGAGSLVVCTNHTNWWDGFVVALMTPFFPGRSVYVAQYEKLLARYRALRWLGAFGLEIHGSALPGLRYALALLRTERKVVWIFPQGVLVPQGQPIRVKPGALWLARRSGAPVLPVVFRYEWMVESRPSVFVSCGRPLPPGAADADLERAMQALYDEIGETLAPVDLSPYRPLFTPRLSMNKLWDWLRPSDPGPFNPRNE